MVNTAEFWVGVSFVICVGISLRLLAPKVKSSLDIYQESIERMFSEAEQTLVAAQKKFGGVRNKFDALPQLAQEMTQDLDGEINQRLNEWKLEQNKISLKYQQIQEHKMQSLINHSKAQTYSIIAQAILNSVETCFKQSFNSKTQQQVALLAIKKLPKI